METEKSCANCCHSMCRCPDPVPEDYYCHNHLMTPAQQYAEELLKALKKATNSLYGAERWYGGGGYDEDIEEYENLIAKVEGKE